MASGDYELGGAMVGFGRIGYRGRRAVPCRAECGDYELGGAMVGFGRIERSCPPSFFTSRRERQWKQRISPWNGCDASPRSIVCRHLADRYHAHILRTPTEVHRALAYVLLNQRKHAAERHPSAPLPSALDAFSSGAWFQGWHSPLPGAARLRRGPPPVVLAPRSWLLREGWRRAGTIAA